CARLEFGVVPDVW
nr:immunoglobulin heavy chain junction region [Macaca mulatta]MOY29582.1 immunoglobulin heavy chain junction region [Macaca mulatta]